MSEDTDRQYLTQSQKEKDLVGQVYTYIEDRLRELGVSSVVLASACVQVADDLQAMAVSRRGSLVDWEAGMFPVEEYGITGGEW